MSRLHSINAVVGPVVATLRPDILPWHPNPARLTPPAAAAPSLEDAYHHGSARLASLVSRLTQAPPEMRVGTVDLATTQRSAWSETAESDMGRDEYKRAVERTKEYILSGDVFQLVLSHR